MNGGHKAVKICFCMRKWKTFLNTYKTTRNEISCRRKRRFVAKKIEKEKVPKEIHSLSCFCSVALLAEQ
jgi:NADH:ubiquinone oxidoreductase subunit